MTDSVPAEVGQLRVLNLGKDEAPLFILVIEVYHEGETEWWRCLTEKGMEDLRKWFLTEKTELVKDG